jgi:hypothetical protein
MFAIMGSGEVARPGMSLPQPSPLCRGQSEDRGARRRSRQRRLPLGCFFELGELGGRSSSLSFGLSLPR